MEWKFSQLDENRDGVLNKKELKTFKADIKKVIRTFWNKKKYNSEILILLWLT
mgnify:CR=1 FL=1